MTSSTSDLTMVPNAPPRINADRQIEHVAAHCERFELLEHIAALSRGKGCARGWGYTQDGARSEEAAGAPARRRGRAGVGARCARNDAGRAR